MSRIYKFQPFSTTKELGAEYNAHCQLVPNDDDWILILDWDVMLLLPCQYELMESAIKLYPDTDIFGAWTNRIGYQHQRLNLTTRRFESGQNKNVNISDHIATAIYMWRQWPKGQCHDAPTIAGFFMLFKKSYWLKNKFQNEIINARGRLFDKQFCQSAKHMRIISGLYVFHQYRITQDNWRDQSHLK